MEPPSSRASSMGECSSKHRASAPPSSTLNSIPHGQQPVLILQQSPGRALRVPLLFPPLPIPFVQKGTRVSYYHQGTRPVV